MPEVSPAQISDEQRQPDQKGSCAANFSLLFGILSNFCFWFVTGIPAIILGVIVIRRINREPSTITGSRRATAGILTGCLGMVVFPILVIESKIFETHPILVEPQCITSMHIIEKVMISYGNLNGIEAGEPAPVQAIVDGGYMSGLPACPAGGIYTYTGKMPSGDAGSAPYTKCSIEIHDFDPWKNEDVDEP